MFAGKKRGFWTESGFDWKDPKQYTSWGYMSKSYKTGIVSLEMAYFCNIFNILQYCESIEAYMGFYLQCELAVAAYSCHSLHLAWWLSSANAKTDM